MPRYNPAVIEPKWQRFWEQNRTFATSKLPKGRKLYVLDMFPYPSGDGLHVGHPEGYTATDIVCRYRRMRGVSVMHPMGWDAFGLPAEQHAKKTGTHPRLTTEQNIANFRRQLKMLGFSYDWDRELATTDPEYFRWTQLIFLVLFDTWFDESQQRGRPIAELPIPAEVAAASEQAVRRYQDDHRLAYQLEAPVNWCPALGTVLANEEVVGGVSERGGHPVMRIPLRQWMLRITAYADRLERDLDSLQWPENIKLLQRNWIGRSTGAEVDFFIGVRGQGSGVRGQGSGVRGQGSGVRGQGSGEFQQWMQARAKTGFPEKPGDEVLRIYTTRPDTLFGATYMVLAPEHPFVERLTTPEQAGAVRAYCDAAARKSELDRTDLAKGKTGVFTGSYAFNPVNGEEIPIWVADYVLISYGTGAIMAVPAHDTRDFEFAQEFKLPIVAVVDPGEAAGVPRKELLAGRAAFIADGVAINSGQYNGLATPEFKQRIAADLAAAGLGRSAVNYKLRDWLFSRQHFWGEPFPILHELDAAGRPTGLVEALRPEELPLDLPERMAFDATHDRPEPPLEEAPADWLYVTRDGKRYKRETNTMPQWAGSCWYYLRFLDPRNNRALVDPQIEKAWMPVDLYVGGAEHAVLHLLYARFWHKVLFDRGYVSTPEPFQKLVNQGMILGEIEYHAYRSPEGEYVSADDDKRIAEYEDAAPGLQMEDVSTDQVEIRDGRPFWKGKSPPIMLTGRAAKMSKSRGNVVNPDEVVAEYGADSLRLYEMFMGPLEAVKPWSMQGVNGVFGFLGRVWRMIIDDRAEGVVLHPAVQDVPPTAPQNRMLHRTIKAVSADIEQMAFNTAIAYMMEFTNFFLKQEPRPREAMEKLVLLLSPFAPHIAEELWQALGHRRTLAYQPWPSFDESLMREETIEVPVQIQGKLRGRIRVAAGCDAAALEAAARSDPRIAELLSGKTIAKVIVVPGRMVNFVVRG
jgi:leucyl-tRNA synthetase